MHFNSLNWGIPLFILEVWFGFVLSKNRNDIDIEISVHISNMGTFNFHTHLDIGTVFRLYIIALIYQIYGRDIYNIYLMYNN